MTIQGQDSDAVLQLFVRKIVFAQQVHMGP